MKDKHIGLLLFSLALLTYLYFLLWAIMTPFLEADNPLLLIFPDNRYALVLPMLVAIIGVSVVTGYIGFRAILS